MKIKEAFKSSEILYGFTQIRKLGDVIPAASMAFEKMATSIGVSTSALTTMLGVVGSVALIVGAAAIAYDALTTSFDEAAEAADSARQKYEQTKSEVESIQNELKATGDRIDELNAKDGLTLVEQDELARLYETESSLERQLAYKQQIAQVEAEAAANAARAALENEGFMAFGDSSEIVKHGFWNDILYSVGQSMAMSQTGQMATFDGGRSAEIVRESQSQSINIVEATIRKQQALNDLQKRQGEILDHTSDEYKDNQDRIVELGNELSSNWNMIEQYRQSITEAGLAGTKEFKDIIEQIGHLEKLRAGYEERGNNGEWIVTDLGKRAEALERVQSFLSKPSLSNSFKELENVLSANPNIDLYGIIAQFPKLSSAAQAAGVNIIDVVNSIKSELGLLNLDEVRNQLRGALDPSSYEWMPDRKSIAFRDQWLSWIDSLSNEDIEILYSIKQSNDTSAWSFADWQAALEEAKATSAETSTEVSAVLEEMQSGFDKASEAASKFYTALSESASDTGLSSDSIQAVKDMFSDLDGYNAFELFEKTTTGVRLNTQALQELNDEYERHTKVEMQNELEALIAEYNTATDALSNYTAGTQEYNDALANVNGLEVQIESALELQAQYEGLTSAYNKFMQAQSSNNNRDPYANIADSYEDIQELLDLGWAGSDDVQEYLDLLIAADQRTNDNYADFERLTQTIAGTDFSIMDFFRGYDEETGKLSSDGLYNFLDAVDQLDDSLVDIKEDGSYAFDWDASDLQQISEWTGLSIEAIQLLEQAMRDTPMDVNIDTPLASLHELQETAKESADQLNRLGLTDVEFDFDSTDLESVNTQISEVQSILDGMRNDDGTINMDLAGADEALDVLSVLEYQKVKLEYPTLMSVDVDSESAESDLNTVLGLLQSFAVADSTVAVAADTETAQANVDSLFSQIQSMSAVIPAELNIDTSSKDALITSLQSMDPEIFATYFANTDELDATNAESDGGDRTTTYTPDTRLVDAVNAVTNGGRRVVVYTPDTDWLPRYFSTLTRYVRYVAVGDTGANGTAHARGTAFARGYWGTHDNGEALGGEVGTELVVRDGRYFTIGDRGAEFFHYKKGDIIFNAEQTRQIFKYGRIKYGKARGNALASGTAFDSGSGGRRRRPPSSSSSSSSSYSSSSSWSSSSSSPYRSSSSYNGNQSASAAASSTADDFAEDLDWIEVLLDRIARKVKLLDSVTSSAFKSMGKRAESSAKQISTISQEIEYQRQGYNEYLNAANSINLSEGYKELVRNGKIQLETITDKELNEKIQKYKELYEKALDCQEAASSLAEEISSLYQGNFDRISKEFDYILGDIDTKSNNIDRIIKDVENTGNIASASLYESLIDVQQERIASLRDEYSELTEKLNDAVSSGAIEEYSEAWYDMQAKIRDTAEAMQDCNSQIIELKRNIRDLQWKQFDGMREAVEGLNDEAEFYIGLLSREQLFTDKGLFNQNADTIMGLHVQEYATNMNQVAKYGEEIVAIQKELAKDQFNKDLIDRRNELVKAQRQSVEAMYDERDAMVSLVEDGIKAQLKYLKDLIDTYKESLDSAKDLYDYQKRVAEQTQKINSIQKQLSAYGGDDSEETRLTVQKLRSSLRDAQEDLNETQYSRYISDQKRLLDDLYDNYEKVLYAKLDDVDALISDLIDTTNINSDEIQTTIRGVASDVGIQVGYQLDDVWSKIDGKFNIFDTISTSVNELIGLVRNEYNKSATEGLIAQMQKNSLEWYTADDETRKVLAEQNEMLAENIGTILGDTITKRGGQWFNSRGETLYNVDKKEAAKNIVDKMRNNSMQWVNASDEKRAALAQENLTLGARYQSLTGIKTWRTSNGVWLTGSGQSLFDTAGTQYTYDVNEVKNVVSRMKALSAQWHKITDPVERARMATMALNYGAQIQAMTGHRVYRDHAGVWWFDNKRLYDVFHEGGIVGGGSIKDDEQFALLRKGEAVLTQDMWKNYQKQTNVAKQVSEAMKHVSSTTNSNTQIEMNISMPNVKDWDDFVNHAINDKRFEQFVQAVTVDRLNGGLSTAKNKFRR